MEMMKSKICSCTTQSTASIENGMEKNANAAVA